VSFSMGVPDINAQWSKTDWGKACPPVACLKSALKPKDSETGKYASAGARAWWLAEARDKTKPLLLTEGVHGGSDSLFRGEDVSSSDVHTRLHGLVKAGSRADIGDGRKRKITGDACRIQI